MKKYIISLFFAVMFISFDMAAQGKILRIVVDGNVAFESSVDDYDYISIFDRLEPPCNVSSSVADGGFTLEWDAVEGADEYEIYRSGTDGRFSLLGKTDELTFTDSSPLPGRNKYRIRAALYDNISDFSAIQEMIKPLLVPVDLGVIASTSSIELSWGAVDGASSYKIYMSHDGDSYAELAVTPSNSYSDRGEIFGHVYYKVEALQDDIVSPCSDPIQTFNELFPPININARYGNGQITLTWDNAPCASAYRVYRRGYDSVEEEVCDVPVNEFIDREPHPGKNYYCVSSVYGIDDWCYIGPRSDQFSAILPLLTPDNFTASLYGASARLAWNEVAGANSYIIYRSSDSVNYNEISRTTSNEYLDNGLPYGNTYYKVVAAQGDVYSQDALSMVTRSLASSSSISGCLLEGVVNISWDSVDDATSYRVYRVGFDNTKVVLGDVEGCVFVDESPLPGFNRYSVSAINGSYVGPEGEGETVVTPLDVPQGLAASVLSSSISLSWNAVAGADKYEVYVSTDGENFSLKNAVKSTNWSDTSIVYGTIYYRVRAMQGDLSSEYCEVVSVTRNLPAPRLSASISDGKITLEWGAVTNADGYQVYRSTDGENYQWLSSPTSNRYVDSNAPSGNVYYKVKSRYGNVYSEYSDILTLVASLDKPTNLTYSIGTYGVRLSWEPVNGAEKYVIYRIDTQQHVIGEGISTSYDDSSAVYGFYGYYVVAVSGSVSSEMSEIVICGAGYGHECVNLGLPSGTMWATMNFGASSAEDYGEYYAIGDRTGYSSMISQVWGSRWQMPTDAQYAELVNNCTITKATINGVAGLVFTGTNGNSIFLPAAGYKSSSTASTITYEGTYCYYVGGETTRYYSWNAGSSSSYPNYSGDPSLIPGVLIQSTYSTLNTEYNPLVSSVRPPGGGGTTVVTGLSDATCMPIRPVIK